MFSPQLHTWQVSRLFLCFNPRSQFSAVRSREPCWVWLSSTYAWTYVIVIRMMVDAILGVGMWTQTRRFSSLFMLDIRHGSDNLRARVLYKPQNGHDVDSSLRL